MTSPLFSKSIVVALQAFSLNLCVSFRRQEMHSVFCVNYILHPFSFFLSNLPLCPFLKLLLLPLRWLSINCTKPVNLLVDIMYFFHVPIFRIAGVHKNVDHRVYKHRGNPDVLVNAERWFMELGVPELLSPDFVKLNNKDCNCKMLTRSAIPDPARSSVSQPLALYATRMLFLQSHASTFPCQKPPRTITTIPPWTGQT